MAHEAFMVRRVIAIAKIEDYFAGMMGVGLSGRSRPHANKQAVVADG